MLSLPQKNDLSLQTLEIIRAEIAAGNWRDWLPAERTLSDLLKISRPTLRRALKALVQERTVLAVHGLGYKILNQPAVVKRSRSVTVHLLSPDPLEQVRHQSQLWIEELRYRLFKAGYDLQIHHGVQYLQRGAERALDRLVLQNPGGLWVLVHSSRVIQRWFTVKRVPAVIIGYQHAGYDLSRVVIRMDAVCRHAAGELIRLGHRHIALVRLKTDRAGDLRSDQSFQEGAKSASAVGVKVQLVQYEEDTPTSIARALQRVMRATDRPTGLLVAHAGAYATVATWLLGEGFLIPKNISLICREDDSFLAYLLPQPAVYQYSSCHFGRSIASLVQQMIRQRDRPAVEIPVIPKYVRGHSVGPPPPIDADGYRR